MFPSEGIPTLHVMLTATKGTATEAAVMNAFVHRDLPVLVPFGDGHPYDLVVHLPTDAFLRVQCKTARPLGACAVFNSRTTDHGRGRLSYLGLADVFGVYFPPRRAVYLVPVHEVPNFIVSLRLKPARNNQRRGIRLARDYEIERWSTERLCELARAANRPLATQLRAVG
jgi:hypothetical protein